MLTINFAHGRVTAISIPDSGLAMKAQTPEDVDRLFAEAVNAGDLDAIVAMYEPHASFVPSQENITTGKAAIRDMYIGFLAMRPKLSVTPKVVAQTGDLAVVTTHWEFSATGSDGKPTTMTGQSLEILRRQPDGGWLFAIDLPNGVQN
jgi:uncharacterized protein (TIGR02246 family)